MEPVAAVVVTVAVAVVVVVVVAVVVLLGLKVILLMKAYQKAITEMFSERQTSKLISKLT